MIGTYTGAPVTYANYFYEDWIITENLYACTMIRGLSMRNTCAALANSEMGARCRCNEWLRLIERTCCIKRDGLCTGGWVYSSKGDDSWCKYRPMD